MLGHRAQKLGTRSERIAESEEEHRLCMRPTNVSGRPARAWAAKLYRPPNLSQGYPLWKDAADILPGSAGSASGGEAQLQRPLAADFVGASQLTPREAVGPDRSAPLRAGGTVSPAVWSPSPARNAPQPREYDDLPFDGGFVYPSPPSFTAGGTAGGGGDPSSPVLARAERLGGAGREAGVEAVASRARRRLVLLDEWDRQQAAAG